MLCETAQGPLKEMACVGLCKRVQGLSETGAGIDPRPVSEPELALMHVLCPMKKCVCQAIHVGLLAGSLHQVAMSVCRELQWLLDLANCLHQAGNDDAPLQEVKVVSGLEGLLSACKPMGFGTQVPICSFAWL